MIAAKCPVSELHQLIEYAMHAICRQTGQRCSLQVVECCLISLRNFKNVQTDEVKQAKKERRRRRRDEKIRLKTIAEDAFGSGSQFFTKEINSSTYKKPQNAAKTSVDNTSTEDRMWRRLLKQSRSSSEAARLRRAWHLWQSTMEASEQVYSSENERDSSRNNDKDAESTKYRAGGGGSSTKTSDNSEWFADWEAAFTSSTNSNFNTDYERFWAYGSSEDARRQEAFARQQKQRQQAGNTHHYLGCFWS